MTPAGKRDERITFERATASRGNLGTRELGSWSSLGGRWAKVHYGTGSERRRDGVEAASQAATFVVLNDSLTSTITAEDRITHRSLTYDITGIARVGRGELEFTATTTRG